MMKTTQEKLIVHYQEIPLSLVDPCPFKFRPLDYTVIERIRKGSRKHGLLSAILVVPKDGGRYWVAYGGHRLKSQAMEGKSTIGALVANLSLEEIGLIAISENANRNNDIDPVAEGNFFVELAQKGRSVEDLAEETGLGVGYIQTRIDLARDLDPAIQTKLSKRHLPIALAHVISKYPRPQQIDRLAEMQKRRHNLVAPDPPNENECQKRCPVHCPKPYGKFVIVKKNRTVSIGPSCAHGKRPDEHCPHCEGDQT